MTRQASPTMWPLLRESSCRRGFRVDFGNSNDKGILDRPRYDGEMLYWGGREKVLKSQSDYILFIWSEKRDRELKEQVFLSFSLNFLPPLAFPLPGF